MAMKQQFLLATNGTPESLVALDYGAWLAGLLMEKVGLLGIVEDSRYESSIRTAFSSVKERLADNNLILTEEIIRGNPVQIICQKALSMEHLLVVGPFGRPGWLRWLRGRSFRYILKDIQAPLIYTRQSRKRLNRILVCLGGLGYASSVEHWALYLAQRSSAEVTLLHIIEPVYYEYPTSNQVRVYGDEIIRSDTPQGRNLRQALQDAEQRGVQVELKVRQGDIIPEIHAELAAQDYDLVALGSPESSHSLRQRFMENITAQIAEKGNLPVLTARLGQEPILE